MTPHPSTAARERTTTMPPAITSKGGLVVFVSVLFGLGAMALWMWATCTRVSRPSAA